jgi:hypothetical protein
VKLSILTPVHATSAPFLEAAYRSLRARTTAWEWILLENNSGVVPTSIQSDPRVHVNLASVSLSGIGALKKQCAYLATGDVLVELDADDELAPSALDRIAEAFTDPSVDVVYSDFAEFLDAPEGRRCAPGYPWTDRQGWRHRIVTVEGVEYAAMHAPPATAHNLRNIEWAPNHVRAWRRSTYDRVGGHDPALEVGDDHDLNVRLFLAGAKFHHIPECLYLYRVHGKNTVTTRNAAIQAQSWRNYERYVWALAEKWSRDNDLDHVDLCGGHDAPAGYRVLDQAVPPHPDLDGRWPLDDSSVGVLRAHDAVEHLRDPVHTMNEAYRVLAPGGFLMISVPSSEGKGAFCDPTHVSYWNDLSFLYYTDREFARYIPAFRGRFQVLRVLPWYPSAWHKENNVPYVEAHLAALKDGYEPMGEIRI